MARKIKLTRPELKRQRDALARFERYLPMLKLKQQQLQLTVREIMQLRREARAEVDAAKARIDPYRPVMADRAGVNVAQLAEPEKLHTREENVAGVRIPVFDSVSFASAVYSLFGTPPWVDRAVADLRELSERTARADVLDRQYELLNQALTKIVLVEKSQYEKQGGKNDADQMKQNIVKDNHHGSTKKRVDLLSNVVEALFQFSPLLFQKSGRVIRTNEYRIAVHDNAMREWLGNNESVPALESNSF